MGVSADVQTAALVHSGASRNKSLVRHHGIFSLGSPSLSVPLLAQFPALRLTQYAHNAWRLQDDALDGAPDAITQTTDGYPWIGTVGGLVRFDGIRFVPWRLPETERQSRFSIYSLFGAKTAVFGSALNPK